MSDHRSESAQNANRKDKEAKVYAEQVKNRHTTHWDLDYMSSKEIEDAYRDESGQNPTHRPDRGEVVRLRWKAAAIQPIQQAARKLVNLLPVAI